jgi:hypothetical protein
MASLSSKSANRFLVNFHTKKAMIPITATPPATDIPTMEPVPSPLELGELASDVAADELADELDVVVGVIVSG